MNKIILISCSSTKLSYKAKAIDLYHSPLFKYSLRYAQILNPDRIYILSAKYGLLDLDEEIEPYDVTLNTMKAKEIRQWSEKVIKQLSRVVDVNKDEILFLTGEKYRKYLIPYIRKYQILLEGMSIGKRLRFLKNSLV